MNRNFTRAPLTHGARAPTLLVPAGNSCDDLFVKTVTRYREHLLGRRSRKNSSLTSSKGFGCARRILPKANGRFFISIEAQQIWRIPMRRPSLEDGLEISSTFLGWTLRTYSAGERRRSDLAPVRD